MAHSFVATPMKRRYVFFSNLLQHEDYNQGAGTYPNDISVIYMASAADTGSPNVDAIARARPEDGDFTGDTCQISGWGRVEGELNKKAVLYNNVRFINQLKRGIQP